MASKFNTFRINEELLKSFKEARKELPIDWDNYESKSQLKLKSTVKAYKIKPVSQDAWYKKLVKTLKVF